MGKKFVPTPFHSFQLNDKQLNLLNSSPENSHPLPTSNKSLDTFLGHIAQGQFEATRYFISSGYRNSKEKITFAINMAQIKQTAETGQPILITVGCNTSANQTDKAATCRLTMGVTFNKNESKTKIDSFKIEINEARGLSPYLGDNVQGVRTSHQDENERSYDDDEEEICSDELAVKGYRTNCLFSCLPPVNDTVFKISLTVSLCCFTGAFFALAAGQIHIAAALFIVGIIGTAVAYKTQPEPSLQFF